MIFLKLNEVKDSDKVNHNIRGGGRKLQNKYKLIKQILQVNVNMPSSKYMGYFLMLSAINIFMYL